MCFAIPGKIIKIEDDWAIVDFIGKKRKVNIKFIDASIGQYVICAGNIAANVIPEEKALSILEALKNANKR